jgi:hypothetical protein
MTTAGYCFFLSDCASMLRSVKLPAPHVPANATDCNWPASQDLMLPCFHAIVALMLLPYQWQNIGEDDLETRPMHTMLSDDDESVMSQLFPLHKDVARVLPLWLRAEYQLRSCLEHACGLTPQETRASGNKWSLSAYMPRNEHAAPVSENIVEWLNNRQKKAKQTLDSTSRDDGVVWDMAPAGSLGAMYDDIHAYVHDAGGWQYAHQLHLFCAQAPLCISTPYAAVRVVGAILDKLREKLSKKSTDDIESQITTQYRSGQRTDGEKRHTGGLRKAAKVVNKAGFTDDDNNNRHLAFAYFMCTTLFRLMMEEIVRVETRRTGSGKSDDGLQFIDAVERHEEDEPQVTKPKRGRPSKPKEDEVTGEETASAAVEDNPPVQSRREVYFDASQMQYRDWLTGEVVLGGINDDTGKFELLNGEEVELVDPPLILRIANNDSLGGAAGDEDHGLWNEQPWWDNTHGDATDDGQQDRWNQDEFLHGDIDDLV